MLEQLMSLAQSEARAALADPVALLAYVAGALAGLLVVSSAFVRTMIPLRWLAVGSNIGFVVYGLAHPAPAVALLHGLLLPVNLWRVTDMIRITRQSRRASDSREQLAVWFRSYMRARRVRAGRVVFRAGDIADRIYFLADGVIDLPEAGRTLQAGEMFGEIAFFAPDRRRSSSAICRTRCTLLSFDEATFRQLCYQDPDFAIQVVSLIAGRLTEELRRRRAQQPPPPLQTSPPTPPQPPRGS
jgi:CRP-like cAMP-binding protein